MARKGISQLADKPISVSKDGKRIFAYNEKGVPVCHARLYNKENRDHDRCQSIATYTNGRCKFHGGRVPSGIMHWNAKDLRTAESMPTHLQGDMNRALNDPDAISLKHELALIDTKIKQQKEALELGLGTAAWKKLRQLAENLDYAIINEPEKTEKICNDLIQTIRQGVREREVWKELDVSIELRRRVADTAHHRERDLKQLLKADQALALVTAIASVCKQNIDKLIEALQKRYSLVDNETGLRVARIDNMYKADFLSSIAIGLGNLIGKTRRDEPGGDITPAQQQLLLPSPKEGG